MGKIKYGRTFLLLLSVLFSLGWGEYRGRCPVSATVTGQKNDGNSSNSSETEGKAGTGSGASANTGEKAGTDRETSAKTKEKAGTDRGTSAKTKEKAGTDNGKAKQQSTKSANNQGSLPAGRKLLIQQIGEEKYLVNQKGKKQTGWYLWSGKNYWKLGRIRDIGLYKTKKFQILYADIEGKIPVDSQVCGVPFDSEGSPSETEGVYHIQGKYYLILQGRLQTTDITLQKDKYYINLDGSVAYYSRRGKCFQPSGKKMNSLKSSEARTRQQARKVIRVITRKSMTRKQKLETCFQWVVDHYGYYEKKCDGKKGWTSESGYQLLRHGSGDCRVLAAGFAFLASELGYQEVSICQDSANRFSGSHCWTQVNGKCYDPLFYNSPRPRRAMKVFCGSTPEQYHSKTHCIANQQFRPGA